MIGILNILSNLKEVGSMNELIIETKTVAKIALAKAHEIEEDTDREMHECLAKLKVWQLENLMAPHGMGRFVHDSGNGPS